MRDNHDSMLTRLFVEKDAALPATAFMTQLAIRLAREQQKQRVRLAVAVVVMLTVAGLVMPWILQTVSVIAALAAEFSEAFGSLLHSPLTWLVGGALTIGMLPVVYVWRAWRD